MALTYKPKKVVAVSKIARDIPSDKPIIFWDSCMLIYILSLAVRDSFGEYDKYIKLLGWIEGGSVTSVTSSVVWEEFSQHFAEIWTLAEKDQNNLKNVLKAYAGCLTEPDKTNISSVADTINLLPILEDIEKRVWQHTYAIKDNANLRNLAHFRVLHKMSPSEKKDQYKDSLIWLTFIQMASDLPLPLYEVFVTANREDFCITKKSSTPQMGIQNDCTTVNAEFTVELETLINLMTRELGRTHP